MIREISHMIREISHIIDEILNSISEIQDAIWEDQVKENAELVIPGCVQSKISPRIDAIHQISYAIGPQQPVVGTGH